MLKLRKLAQAFLSLLAISFLGACGSNPAGSVDSASITADKGLWKPQAVVCDEQAASPAQAKTTQYVSMTGTTYINTNGTQNIASNTADCGGNGGTNIGGGDNQVVIINGQDIQNGDPQSLMGQRNNDNTVSVPVSASSVGCGNSAKAAYVIYGH
jgi:hypothetical protein